MHIIAGVGPNSWPHSDSSKLGPYVISRSDSDDYFH